MFLVPPVIVDSSVVIARTVVLLVLLVLSLVGNSLIVLSVAQARSSRYFPFNAFILSMASFGLLECTLTMSLATGKVYCFTEACSFLSLFIF